MTTPTLAMTELDAVNQMLASIGQAPVSSLAVSGIRDVAIAQLSLDTVLREVLTRGWSFNTDYEYELTPDGSDNIIYPTAAAWVDPCDKSKDYVVRDNGGTLMLYDREDKTFTITDNPLEVDVVWMYEFDEIPQVARHYIAMRAARVFQSQVIGSDILFKYTELHEQEALTSLKRMESRTKRVNFIDNQPAYSRTRNPTRF